MNITVFETVGTVVSFVENKIKNILFCFSNLHLKLKKLTKH
jgi:hypothetical protein